MLVECPLSGIGIAGIDRLENVPMLGLDSRAVVLAQQYVRPRPHEVNRGHRQF